jgi:cytochrome c oxidase subunit 3
MYFHMFTGGLGCMLLGFLATLYVMFVWWRDIIREATWQGYHTKIVQKGIKIGVILFIISEIMFFFAFFWAFFHSSLAPTIQIGSVWPPVGIIPLDPFKVPLLNTAILLWSGCTLTWSHHGLRSSNKFAQYIGLVLTIVLAIEFTVYQASEYINAPFFISDGIYGSTFYMATGLHGLHVIIGTLFLIVCFYRMIKGHFSYSHHVGYEAAIWYWHFVDVVWLFLFSTIYCWGSGLFYMLR